MNRIAREEECLIDSVFKKTSGRQHFCGEKPETLRVPFGPTLLLPLEGAHVFWKFVNYVHVSQVSTPPTSQRTSVA